MADKLLGRLSPLGKASPFPARYDPSLLYALPRSIARKDIGIGGRLPFAGLDLWTCYELTWENSAAVPQVAVCRLKIPCDSPNLIESKSLKLYLNSLSAAKYSEPSELGCTIKEDLQRILHAEIEIEILLTEKWSSLQIQEASGILLDKLTPRKISKSRDAKLLKTEDETAQESLYSNLFRTFCPVTGQPDWGSVMITYSGRKLEPLGLFEYLLSLRQHQGFHEECAELIFVDLMEICRPEKLQVQLNFTRRGGIEINPLRHTLGYSSAEEIPLRLARQ